MLTVFQNSWLAAIEMLLVSIPESVGVLVFGLGFTSLAFLARRLFDDPKQPGPDEKTGNEA